MSGELRIAAIQHDIVWNDREANFEHLAPMIAAAAGAGAGLVLCTETFSTGFAVDVPDLGEPEGGPVVARSSPARRASTASGSAARARRSRPTHRPTTGGRTTASCSPVRTARSTATARSTRSRSPARRSSSAPATELVTVEIEGLRVSLFVCYDLRFADEFWQLAADTDVYLVPANWPAKRRLHWQALLQARAIENQAYVVGVNRVGEGGGLAYSGDSRIVDPLGELLATAAAHRDDPARRHLRRPRRRGPRPLPVPPGPPLKRPLGSVRPVASDDTADR